MSEREALALLAKADKKATTFGWFGSNKFEDAAELYTKAANSFKLAKRCEYYFIYIACYLYLLLYINCEVIKYFIKVSFF